MFLLVYTDCLIGISRTATRFYGEALMVTVASVLAEVSGKLLETFCR